MLYYEPRVWLWLINPGFYCQTKGVLLCCGYWSASRDSIIPRSLFTYFIYTIIFDNHVLLHCLDVMLLLSMYFPTNPATALCCSKPITLSVRGGNVASYVGYRTWESRKQVPIDSFQVSGGCHVCTCVYRCSTLNQYSSSPASLFLIDLDDVTFFHFQLFRRHIICNSLSIK